MIALQSFFILLLAAALCYWLMQFYVAMRFLPSIPLVNAIEYDTSFAWPRVSVVIPARNEAGMIKKAVTMRLQSDYPNLEIILVDDRSEDGTGEIIDELAAKDKRVHVIHIRELPNDWIGKLYAMQYGAEIATGEWLLFSDADVFVKPGTLKRVVWYAQHHGYDHVSAIPHLMKENFLVDVVLSAFMRQICIFGQPWQASNPRSRVGIGSGAFNMVHRGIFEHICKFEKLRMTVTDDLTFGRILKQAGARPCVLNGRGSVMVHFYSTLHAVAVGSERALFSFFGGFSAVRLIILSIAMFLIEISPFVILAPVGIPLLFHAGIFLITIMIVTSFISNKCFGRPAWTAFFVPLAILIMTVCMIRAAILGKKRGGIIWRGTFYSSDVLKQHTQ